MQVHIGVKFSYVRIAICSTALSEWKQWVFGLGVTGLPNEATKWYLAYSRTPPSLAPFLFYNGMYCILYYNWSMEEVDNARSGGR